jgi:UDP-2,4-diacetamido-2,4,6-trideoxy-beta-L-altropyranose hydrolase
MRAKSGYDGQVDVVVGKHYPYFAELNQLALTQNRIKLHRQSDQMASLILSADLAIGAGGTMAWERAWLYLPSLVTAIAPNQTQQVDCLEQLGIAEQIKSDLTAYSNNLYTALEAIQQAPQHLTAMSNRAKIAVQNTPLVVWSEIFQTIAQRKMA